MKPMAVKLLTSVPLSREMVTLETPSPPDQVMFAGFPIVNGPGTEVKAIGVAAETAVASASAAAAKALLKNILTIAVWMLTCVAFSCDLRIRSIR